MKNKVKPSQEGHKQDRKIKKVHDNYGNELNVDVVMAPQKKQTSQVYFQEEYEPKVTNNDSNQVFNIEDDENNSYAEIKTHKKRKKKSITNVLFKPEENLNDNTDEMQRAFGGNTQVKKNHLKKPTSEKKTSSSNQSRKKIIDSYDIGDPNKFVKRIITKDEKFECNLGRKVSFLSAQFGIYKGDGSLLINTIKTSSTFGSVYNISTSQQQTDQTSRNYFGKVKSNVGGSKFNIYLKNHSKNEQKLQASVYFGSGCGCGQKLREIQVFIRKFAEDNIPPQADLKQFCEANLQNRKNFIKLVNKKPVWNPQKDTYIMDFKGKAKISSINNTIFVDEENPSEESLLVGKNGENEFGLQISYPLSAALAMGIITTCFDWKWVTQ